MLKPNKPSNTTQILWMRNDRLLKSCCNLLKTHTATGTRNRFPATISIRPLCFPRLTEKGEVWPMTYCSEVGQEGSSFLHVKTELWLLGSQFSLLKSGEAICDGQIKRQPPPLCLRRGQGALICSKEGERRAGHSRSLVNQTEEKPRKRQVICM